MPALKPSRIAEKDYLAGEQHSQVRHEYVDGQIQAMSGGSLRHNVIAGNLYMALRTHLRGRHCVVTMESVQVHVAKTKAYYYPDVVVSCPTDGAGPVFPKRRRQPLAAHPPSRTSQPRECPE